MGRGVHFRSTTPAQRRLLFETWQETDDVETACATAHVGRRTFYYWKGRFTTGGYGTRRLPDRTQDGTLHDMGTRRDPHGLSCSRGGHAAPALENLAFNIRDLN